MGLPRKIWFDGGTEDLKTMYKIDWHEIVQDKEKWHDITVTAKNSQRVVWPE